MRSLLIILGTMLLLAGGFFLYFWMQPATRIARPENSVAIPTSRPVLPDGQPASQPTVGAGEGAWLKHFDDKTLELSYEFRGTHFQPQKNGTVDVEEPEARFYLDKGQLLTILGKRGNVVMENQASPMGTRSGGSQMPSRGELHAVVISLYPGIDAPKPSLVCKMNNAAFDNDTFSISTAAYTDESGKEVPADQVAVEVRGDYEFDGKGLTIRWNERDKRLQMLEIAHGERLLVKDPSAVGKTFGGGPTSNASTKSSQQEIAAAPAPDAPTKPAVGKKKKPGAQQAPVVAKAPRVDPIYRASFNQDVKVLRDKETVATADVMHVDFLSSDKHKAATQPAAPPPSAPSTRTAKKKKPATAIAHADTPPATAPAPQIQPTPATMRVATTKPSPVFSLDSDESQQPMTILWTGKLRVAPIENLEDPPADSKDAVVRMLGAPVVLIDQGSTVRGGMLSFHTGRQDGYIRGTEQFPVVEAIDADHSKIHSPSIEYSNEGRLATLHGPSSADIPVPGKPDEKPKILHAEWTKLARIYLRPAAADSQKMVIERAEFDGAVHINQPQQLDLQSQSLALAFDPPQPSTAPATTKESVKQPDLREMIATGSVRTVLTDDAGKAQKIDCGKLNLATTRDASGKIYPHIVRAIGNVHTSDPDQDLTAGSLVVTLKPSTKPSTEPADSSVASTNVQLDELMASDNVRVVTKSGSTASADTLTAKGPEGDRHVELIGQPASVGDPQSKLEGKIISFDEADQKAYVKSEGKLHAIQQGATTRPIDVAWTQDLAVDGKSNIIDIRGGVTVASDVKDDTTSAKSNQVRLWLMDKAPAAQESATASASTKPTKLASAGPAMNAFQNKTVKKVEMHDNVEVHAKQSNDVDVTQLALFTSLLDYDMEAKLMTIPTKGRMLYQQDPLTGTPSTQPTTQVAARTTTSAPTTGGMGDLSNLHGATAFEWLKEFRYDEVKMQAKMTGDVRIVHQASDLTGPAYELDANEVIADMEERPQTEKAPATQPQQKLRVRRMVANQNVTFQSDKLHFDAQHIEYDPNTRLLVATGTDRAPAMLHEAEGFSSGTFSELHFNTQTEELEVRGFQAQIRRTK
ncbi:MAG TPA: hypothetical protein VL282_11085 [Tepidisphaeraceae bacterium]|nr:hypothetical protein [Tepidisphaeraceae bacterium]